MTDVVGQGCSVVNTETGQILMAVMGASASRTAVEESLGMLRAASASAAWTASKPSSQALSSRRVGETASDIADPAAGREVACQPKLARRGTRAKAGVPNGYRDSLVARLFGVLAVESGVTVRPYTRRATATVALFLRPRHPVTGDSPAARSGCRSVAAVPPSTLPADSSSRSQRRAKSPRGAEYRSATCSGPHRCRRAP